MVCRAQPDQARTQFLLISRAFGLLTARPVLWSASIVASSDLLGGWNVFLDSPGSCKVDVVKGPSRDERGLPAEYLGIEPLESPLFR